MRAIGRETWDACACPEAACPEVARPEAGGPDAATGSRAQDPFTRHAFLAALEESGSVGPGTGWGPRPATLARGGEVIAVAPLYLKSDSQGEYIFDFGWADAFERAGGRYYPKLQVAVPFTPATGRRLLTRPGHEAEGRAGLIEGLVQLAAREGLSSLHITFCTEDEAAAGEARGLLRRHSQQFQWENPGYESFDAFLATLSSRKRKNIRKERAEAQGFGGTIHALTGEALQPRHWDAFWRFYQDTGSRKWGHPYLTRAFFDLIQRDMRDEVLLVLAERDGRPVAGALNFIGRETLFGRYWGCTEYHPALHFELCYYQAIDYAIAHGLRVEAGAQGAHKLARGYLPHATHSLHWIANPGFRRAVARFLEAEAQEIDEEMALLTAFGPFRKAGSPEKG